MVWLLLLFCFFFQDVTSVVINRIDFSTGADAVFGKLWCVCVCMADDFSSLSLQTPTERLTRKESVEQFQKVN